MHLPAMMRLVLEEMGQHIVASIPLDACSTMNIDDGSEAVFIPHIDKIDQFFVQFRLGSMQLRHGVERFFLVKSGKNRASHL